MDDMAARFDEATRATVERLRSPDRLSLPRPQPDRP